MKQLLFLTISLAIWHGMAAQEGLEGIFLETYYITDENDARDPSHSGDIPAGSVTYRLYVDLAPGYRVQAAYGTKEAPLIIKSNANFYNHVESGQAKANIVPLRSYKKNTVLLDSWLSLGAASQVHMAIPKKYDTPGVDSILQLNKTYFQNKSKKFIPIWERDGMTYVDSLPFPQFFKIDSAEYVLMSAVKGNEVRVSNGAWACFGKGAIGADSLTTNSVLIAQLTTKGKVEYKLNLMIGTPDGRSIKYTYVPGIDQTTYHPALEGSSHGKKKKKKKKNQKA
jgi:hypothetical protein